MDEDFLSSDGALTAFLTRFINGTWPVADFRHTHHLAVAVCSVLECRDPMLRLRTGIRSYNVMQGGENTEDRGYHETITRFWLEIVSRYIATLPSELARIEIARRVVSEFALKRDLFNDYYDFNILKSREARAAWIPPAKPFPEQQSSSLHHPNN